MVAMSIFFIGIIASKARFASPPPAASASVSARGVICQEHTNMKPKNTICLWFDKGAHEAARFYAATLDRLFQFAPRVINVSRP